MRIASTPQLQITTHHQKQSREEVHERLLMGDTRGGFSADQLSNGLQYERTQVHEELQGSHLASTVQTSADAAWRPDTLAAIARQARALGAQALSASAPPNMAVTPNTTLASLTASAPPTGGSPPDEQPQDRDALEVALLIAVIEGLSGKSLGLQSVKPLALAQVTDTTSSIAAPPTSAAQSTGGAPEVAAPEFGLSYQYSHDYSESELSEYSVSTSLRTTDGRELSLSLAFSMSRNYSTSESISLRAGAALKDPLVLSFSGTAALTGDLTRFDLNSDGQLEQVNLLAGNSAFLALDRNGSGRIENGSELFGALSGNGFAELAAYDLDANGFIDEGDSVFGALKLWQRDAQGVDSLRGLKEAGIGALGLSSADTPFELTAAGSLAGKVRSSGFYLNENGTGGALQQIDLVT